MKRRFIILLNSSTAQQNDAFKVFLKENDATSGYWHWINNSWLITTHNPGLSSEQIGNKLMEIYPNIHNMILELKEDGTDNWRGFGPSGEKKNMFRWMHKNWNKTESVE